jgi:hypothetical protein
MRAPVRHTLSTYHLVPQTVESMLGELSADVPRVLMNTVIDQIAIRVVDSARKSSVVSGRVVSRLPLLCSAETRWKIFETPNQSNWSSVAEESWMRKRNLSPANYFQVFRQRSS